MKTGECSRETCYGLVCGGKVSLRRKQFLLGSEIDVQRSCGLLEDLWEAVWLEH